MTNLEELKIKGEAPEFMTEAGYKTLCSGYLQDGETPRAAYRRLAKSAASYYKDSEKWEEKFFDVLWKNWLCPASPVLSNLGTEKGLPISCNAVHVDDSLNSIYMKQHELGMLSKNGAGVAVYFGDVRPRGELIGANGKSEGIIPFLKCFDSVTHATNQGNTRRGATAVYLPVEHGDFGEFISIRRPTGDVNRQCLNLHHGVTITDKFMESLESGDVESRTKWETILKTRFETGEPYLFFVDTANRGNPKCYTDKGLSVKTSNLCSEISLHTDPDHSFVCCLSSLNLTRWDEWKDTDLVEVGIRFLDAVMQEYIDKSEGKPGLEASRRSAIKGRAVGLGVLGWHTLLQEKMIPFDSFDAMTLNAKIFSTMKKRGEKATAELAAELGEPEWCVGHGRRNTHLFAIAPTFSNSIISGGHSAGVEPIFANYYTKRTAKGVFIEKNPTFIKVLEKYGKNTPEVLRSINENGGSCQHLDFLTDHEKRVFLTAGEINQFSIVKQAAQRQAYIDQAQSINLFFGANSEEKYIHDVHMEAWRNGLKSLYYLRSESVLKADNTFRQKEECAACEG